MPSYACSQFIEGLFQRKKCVEIHLRVINFNLCLTVNTTPAVSHVFILNLIDDSEEILLDNNFLSLSFQWGLLCWLVAGTLSVILRFRKHRGQGRLNMGNLLTLTFAYFFPLLSSSDICLCPPLLSSLCHSKGIYCSYPAQHVQFSWENIYGWCLGFIFTFEAVVENHSSQNSVLSY